MGLEGDLPLQMPSCLKGSPGSGAGGSIGEGSLLGGGSAPLGPT